MKNKKILISVILCLTMITTAFGATIWFWQSQNISKTITIVGLEATVNSGYPVDYWALTPATELNEVFFDSVTFSILDYEFINGDDDLAIRINVDASEELANATITASLGWTSVNKFNTTAIPMVDIITDEEYDIFRWRSDVNPITLEEGYFQFTTGASGEYPEGIALFRNIDESLNINNLTPNAETIIVNSEISRLMYNATMINAGGLVQFEECNGATIFFSIDTTACDYGVSGTINITIELAEVTV